MTFFQKKIIRIITVRIPQFTTFKSDNLQQTKRMIRINYINSSRSYLTQTLKTKDNVFEYKLTLTTKHHH